MEQGHVYIVDQTDMTASYYHQSRGLIERFYLQLKASLAATTQDHNDWAANLPQGAWGALISKRTSLKADVDH